MKGRIIYNIKYFLTGIAMAGMYTAAAADSPNTGAYSPIYIKSNTNQIAVDIPEVSELVKIILLLNQDMLEEAIRRKYSTAENVYRSDYYKDVLKQFYPFKKEKIVGTFHDLVEDNGEVTPCNYSKIRKYSSLYKFNELGKITPYKYYDIETSNIDDILKPYISLLEEFALKTNFRSFYKDHAKSYEDAKLSYMELVPVNSLWNYIENHFPKKVQYFKIITSPVESYFNRTDTYPTGHDSFIQYTYYAPTPFFMTNVNKDYVNDNLIRNSFNFFQPELFQYLDDYFSNDSNEMKNIVKPSDWIYCSYLDYKKFSGKEIFYNYIGRALFKEYYKKHLDKTVDKTTFYERLDLFYTDFLIDRLTNRSYLTNHTYDQFSNAKYGVVFLKEDKFQHEFNSLYGKYGESQFSIVLEELKKWCKEQK